MRPLSLAFFRRPAEVVAPDLIGATIVSGSGSRLLSGIIIETEAYLGSEDPASHAYLGRRNEGNASLYGAPGTWYVYRSYGIHWCANLVCRGPGAGGAVLLRGVELRVGVDLARRRRGAVDDRRLADGPGKLTQALGITRMLDGKPMKDSEVVIGRGRETGAHRIVVTPRIGISRAVEWPLRFVLSSPRP